MIIITYSAANDLSIATQIGRSEYSYYFVRKEFERVLQDLGKVVVVENPRVEVDPIYFDARRRGEPCVFLSFTPPQFTPFGLACPTIPVLAWEFDTIPSETWYYECEQDWRYILNLSGRAIAHSSESVKAIRAAMGEDYPVVSIPAPVWDRFAPWYHERATGPTAGRTVFSASGIVIDSHAPGKSFRAASQNKGQIEIALEGIIYLSVFNPKDGRKNADDMMDAFCSAFRDTADATLILKLSHTDCEEKLSLLYERMQQLMPYRCRFLMIAGYLETNEYERLVGAASYAVNTSSGEGQCLPIMEHMSCGKPAVAPNHSGMADYVNSENSFVVRSANEPSAWPHDPRYAFRVFRRRINSESLVEAYRESYRVAKNDPERYTAMGRNAHETLRRHCSRQTATERIVSLLETPLRTPVSGSGYGHVRRRVDVPWDDAVDLGARCLNYHLLFESSVLSFARRGMKVDAVGPSNTLRDAASALSKLNPIDLSFYDGVIGCNPSERPGAYNLILVGERQLPVFSLHTAVGAFRSMLAPGGRIIVARERTRRSLSRWAGEEIRAYVNHRTADERLLDGFSLAGFSCRSYQAKLDDRNAFFHEFWI
jgi:glycosyltransferase involved in cell wall biosynthesis